MCDVLSGIIDHVGGLAGILRAFPSDPPAVYKQLVEPYDDPVIPNTQQNEGFQYRGMKDGDEFKCDGAVLRAVFTPGHCGDHVSFLDTTTGGIQRTLTHRLLVTHRLPYKVLYSGDCVLGEGTTKFDNLYVYMQSLYKLLKYNVTQIYPGHGGVLQQGREKVEEYIAHRMERENQIIQLLREQDRRPKTSKDMCDVMYKGYPEGVLLAAEDNILLHLDKLTKEGRAEALEDGTWRWIGEDKCNI
jgi:glyoxylase-like metal-dependent hydrolase (beta-lactamase superfamily II)